MMQDKRRGMSHQPDPVEALRSLRGGTLLEKSANPPKSYLRIWPRAAIASAIFQVRFGPKRGHGWRHIYVG
jgi:hypothetical protein